MWHVTLTKIRAKLWRVTDESIEMVQYTPKKLSWPIPVAIITKILAFCKPPLRLVTTSHPTQGLNVKLKLVLSLSLRNWCGQHKQTSQFFSSTVTCSFFYGSWTLFKYMPPRLPTQGFSSLLITLNCCVRQASGFQSRSLSIYRFKYPRQKKSLASGLRNFIDKVTIFKIKSR